MRGGTVADRFWSKVDVRGEKECWHWMASRFPKGYGQFQLNGQPRNAHRVVWEFEHGPIPQGLFICHHCDNPPCVNPNHLFLGTASDNTLDCVAKSRNNPALGDRHGSHTKPESRPRGEAFKCSKLTEAQVREIKASNEMQTVLAKRYGVHKATVNLIKLGINWKHVQEKDL